MALVRPGSGIVDIRGTVGGVHFSRDKSGLHVCSHPRTVHRRSSAQDKQRKAFVAARAYCKNVPLQIHAKGWHARCVSYNIYRALNALAPADPPLDYRPDMR